jgi:hypothetical protein
MWMGLDPGRYRLDNDLTATEPWNHGSIYGKSSPNGLKVGGLNSGWLNSEILQFSQIDLTHGHGLEYLPYAENDDTHMVPNFHCSSLIVEET